MALLRSAVVLVTLPGVVAWTAAEGCPGKTYAEGGCPKSRCDKNVNKAKKVCEDATECTVQCCAKKCNNGEGLEGSECKFFAWEEKAQGIGDCYVFDACQDYGEDDYITYAAEPKTSELWAGKDCETIVGGDKPLCDTDFEGGGCPKSRCSKSLNDNVKICDDEYICSVECCAQYCKEHKDFTCAWYSWEPKEGLLGNCYIFKDCQGYDNHDDYVTYKSKAESTPWTGKNCPAVGQPEVHDGTTGDCSKDSVKKMADGGCPLSRCDKDTNDNEKVCDDEKPKVECTVQECEKKCDADDTCAYYAWELKSPVAGEGNCYTFKTCNALNPHDDYTTYLRTSDLPQTETESPDAGIAFGMTASLPCLLVLAACSFQF
eukprot:TRINITY_DN6900_c0_g1_i1.p1 TRINITY_DN6900_c0_g1~~TRINITY_DN6900_c0_g1_i1.p1  ORF type:complete len:374 (+),score=79.74 TRINITY_DN6900_c0_g1_i1:89-1210(+)